MRLGDIYWLYRSMKHLASMCLIISFVGVGVFGLSALEHSMSRGQSDCLASIMTNVPCLTNLKDVATHHLAAIQSFLNIPVGAFVFSIILLIVVSAIGLASLFRFLFLRSQYITERSRNNRLGSNLGKHKLISWLALFEHSPSI